VDHVRAIEHFIGQKIPRMKLEGFNYLYTILFEEGKSAPRRAGGRRRR
jgi:ATP-dependent RNA helicase RhlE